MQVRLILTTGLWLGIAGVSFSHIDTSQYVPSTIIVQHGIDKQLPTLGLEDNILSRRDGSTGLTWKPPEESWNFRENQSEHFVCGVDSSRVCRILFVTSHTRSKCKRRTGLFG